MTELQTFATKLNTFVGIMPPVTDGARYKAWFQMFYLELDASATDLGLISAGRRANAAATLPTETPEESAERKTTRMRILGELEQFDDFWILNNYQFHVVAHDVMDVYRLGGSYEELMKYISNPIGQRFVDLVEFEHRDSACHGMLSIEVEDVIEEFYDDEKERCLERQEEKNDKRLAPAKIAKSEQKDLFEEESPEEEPVKAEPFSKVRFKNAEAMEAYYAYKVKDDFERDTLLDTALKAIGDKGWQRNKDNMPTDGRRLMVAEAAMNLGMEDVVLASYTSDKNNSIYETIRKSGAKGTNRLVSWLSFEMKQRAKELEENKPVVKKEARRPQPANKPATQPSGFEADFDSYSNGLATYLRDGILNLKINHKEYCILPKHKFCGKTEKQITVAINNLYYTKQIDERFGLWTSLKMPEYYLIGPKSLPAVVIGDFRQGLLSPTIKAPTFSLPLLREKIEQARATGAAEMEVKGLAEEDVDRQVQELLAKLNYAGKIDFVVTDGKLVLENRG